MDHWLRNGIQLCGNTPAISLARSVGNRVNTSLRYRDHSGQCCVGASAHVHRFGSEPD